MIIIIFEFFIFVIINISFIAFSFRDAKYKSRSLKEIKIQKINKKQIGNQIFWWNKLTRRTLVLSARFGAWSEKTVIISLGGLAIPFKRSHKESVFSSAIFDNHSSLDQRK